MPTQKKSKEKKPKKAKDEDSDDYSDDDEKEEEEETEGVHAKNKRLKGRKAFASLARQILSLVPLAMVLAQQPFMEKPRQPGVNRVKLIPLQLAITGAVHWSSTSPTAVRNPKLGTYLNGTAQVLLTPTSTSRRARARRLPTARRHGPRPSTRRSSSWGAWPRATRLCAASWRCPCPTCRCSARTRS